MKSGYALQSMLFTLLFTFSAASQPQSSAEAQKSECPPPIIDAPTKSGVSTTGGSLRFKVGSKEIVTCEADDHVKVVNTTTNSVTKVRCIHMRDRTARGTGYAPESYEIAHLWFFVSDKDHAGLVQIGAYKEKQQISWTVTDYLCKK